MNRRAATLFEMMMVPMLITVFAGVGYDLAVRQVTAASELEQSANRVTIGEHALGQLRRDVWSAQRIEMDAETLRLHQPREGPITWRFTDTQWERSAELMHQWPVQAGVSIEPHPSGVRMTIEGMQRPLTLNAVHLWQEVTR